MRRLKKGASGAVTNYVSRRAALRKLQLSLKDFRRLCILKGIYPHEPKSSKKVAGGSSEKKTWYFAKDIDFLAHEPIIDKFREYKVFLRKVKKAKDKREKEAEERLKENRPTYKLDRILRERYPRLEDAVRDLDDALSMIFLFARMPTSARVRSEAVLGAQRFAAEFLHWLMEAKALRKAFISIKGIYFQADVGGESVTWLQPHQRGQPPPSDVDFQVCATFLQLYNSLLGFVNFALYQRLGLFYPPRLRSGAEARVWEMDGGLGQSLAKTPKSEEEEELEELEALEEAAETGQDEMRKAEQERVRRLPKLFQGLRFFLGREVPAEPLLLILRSCGGVVSWEGPNALFPVTDPSITHQICDRPKVAEGADMRRLYVQPQWAFDCLNAGRRLGEADYFPGALLPPHLSPFVTHRPGDYVPAERIQELQSMGLPTAHLSEQGPPPSLPPPPKRSRKEEKEKEAKAVVAEGRPEPPLHPQAALNKAGEERKLRESLIPKKRRRVYAKIKRGKAKAARDAAAMAAKRAAIDAKA